jgi:protein-L-isoaspartate O-methyltransferase
MAWTKADYDAAYLCRVDRYFNRDNPEVAQDPAQTSEVLLHYHRFFMRPILASMWARLAPILNIAATENVLIIGAGFGWGVEAFIAETGCTTVGIDVSDYINAEKNNTEETEIDAAIVIRRRVVVLQSKPMFTTRSREQT